MGSLRAYVFAVELEAFPLEISSPDVDGIADAVPGQLQAMTRWLSRSTLAAKPWVTALGVSPAVSCFSQQFTSASAGVLACAEDCRGNCGPVAAQGTL
jgi:hypothetical protein